MKSNNDIISPIFNELYKGNNEPLLQPMAEDYQGNWMGFGQGSRSFNGK